MTDLNPTWRIEREPASKVFLVLADAIRLDPELKGKVKAWLIPGRYELLRPDLREMLDAVAAGRFSVPVDATYPLPHAADAHRRLASRAALGKVVLVAEAG